MGMQQAIQHQGLPNIPVKNVQNNQQLQSDFEVQYETEVVRINANKYKTRNTEHSNQLITALFNPSADKRLKRLWPEDLAQQHNCSEPPMDGAGVTTFSHLTLTNYSI